MGHKMLPHFCRHCHWHSHQRIIRASFVAATHVHTVERHLNSILVVASTPTVNAAATAATAVAIDIVFMRHHERWFAQDAVSGSQHFSRPRQREPCCFVMPAGTTFDL
jgi:hypothetical protein